MSVLEIEGLTVDLGSRTVLHEVDLQVSPGELLGLLGPNGAGKSTLLRSILRLTPSAAGKVTLDGRSVDAIPMQELAREIAYLAQQGPVHWPLSVERLVALGRFPHLSHWQQLSEQDQSIVDLVLHRTDLLSLRSRVVTTLSGGERTRALLGRALSVDAPILLADEPVAALDPAHQLQIMELLRSYCANGHSVIVVMHDLTLAARYCHRLALMHEGRIVTTGPASAVLQPRHLAEVYHIDALYGPDDGFYVIPWKVSSP